MLLILFATHTEAAATIAALNARPSGEKALIWTEGDVPSLYSFEQGWIALTGIGIHAAQQTVCRFASKVDEIWNLGFAGSLNKEFPLGTLQSIAKVGKYIPEPEILDPLSCQCVDLSIPTFALSCPGATLISTDFPIHTSFHQNILSKKWNLVDMEGYGIAYAAHHLQKPYQLWKIISDFTSQEGRALIRTHQKQFSEQLAEKTLFLLNKELYASKAKNESCRDPLF